MLSVSANSRLISFDGIAKGIRKTVRVTDDGMIYAVDLAMVVTGLSRNDAGQALRRLPDKVFPSGNLPERNLPGKGNAHTKLLTFKHAIELIMVLPGTIAKKIRQKFADIITRYIAGDATLVDEIKANAVSVNPISQLARNALTPEQLEEKRKRRRALEDISISERQLELEKKRVELDLFKVKAPVDFVIHCMTTIDAMCGGLEDRDKKRYKAMLNISADAQVRHLTITNNNVGVEDEVAYVPTPTSISDIVNRMEISGLKSSDYQQIGKIAKRMYVASHDGNIPTQHNQEGANGQWFKVNDYYLETDEQMLKDAVNEFMDKHSKV
jgi:hypothetical protein